MEGTTATNEIRVFPLKNATAEELQQVIQSVIDGEASGGGGGGGGGRVGEVEVVVAAKRLLRAAS